MRQLYQMVFGYLFAEDMFAPCFVSFKLFLKAFPHLGTFVQMRRKQCVLTACSFLVEGIG